MLNEVVAKTMLCKQLSLEMTESLNWPGYELREKAHKKGEFENICFWFCAVIIHINGVSNRLKSVK